MPAVLQPLVAAFLAEWGDKTQMLAILLALRFERSAAVLLGIGLAALLNSLLSAGAGMLMSEFIAARPLTLMSGIALIMAGIGSFLPQKPPKLEHWAQFGGVFTSFLLFGALEFGDKTQFVTMTLAARADQFWLPALGATGGIMLASAPAVFLRSSLATQVPMQALRMAAGILLIAAGTALIVSALRLI